MGGVRGSHFSWESPEHFFLRGVSQSSGRQAPAGHHRRHAPGTFTTFSVASLPTKTLQVLTSAAC